MARFLAELRSFISGLPEPRIVMDQDYRIVIANPAYIREFSAGQPIMGRTCYEVSHHFNLPCDQAGESCPLKQVKESKQAQRVLHLHHTPRGEEHVDVEIVPILDENGGMAYFVETLHVVQQASGHPAAQGLVGRSPRFTRMLEQVLRVARADTAVLLLGETGTGKELVAQALHQASERRDGPFVTVDCAGLTENLFESELFGYEKGAFTGANHRKLGLVELASGGTLFLDEIGELPLTLQVKLLRLLETGTYRRVGGLDTLRADFRLVTATHRHLAKMVAAEAFRQDLYFRINTFPIHTPALHERREDIPLLATSLLERFTQRNKGRYFSAEALSWLQKRHFSGNIRELRNLIERSTLLCDNEEIGVNVLEEAIQLDTYATMPPGNPSTASPTSFTPELAALSTASSAPSRNEGFRTTEVLPLATLEKRYLDWLITTQIRPLAELAPALGISLRTLYRKLEAGNSE